MLQRGEEVAGIHREASMALVCSCLNRERGREVRGIHRRRRKREEGDGRERDDLVVVTDVEGSSGGAAACGGAREARGESDGVGVEWIEELLWLAGRASQGGAVRSAGWWLEENKEKNGFERWGSRGGR